jgi:Ca2+:H+ antiporter
VRPQIAIFVLPTVVLVGWATGHPFTLDLDPLSAIILTMSGAATWHCRASAVS